MIAVQQNLHNNYLKHSFVKNTPASLTAENIEPVDARLAFDLCEHIRELIFLVQFFRDIGTNFLYLRIVRHRRLGTVTRSRYLLRPRMFLILFMVKSYFIITENKCMNNGSAYLMTFWAV
jgi:hypothetical protein